MGARATILFSVLVIVSITAFGGWYVAGRRSAELRRLAARIEFLEACFEKASLERPEPRPEAPADWPQWPVLETNEEPNASQPVPATVKEPKPERRISGRKIVEGLGKIQAMVFCRTLGQQSNEDFANFLRGWTGVDLDVGDKYTDETLCLLRGKFKDQLQVVERDDALRSLRIRKQLEEKAESQEAPAGVPLPPRPVGQLREREQDCEKALASWLDEVGSYLEAGHLAEKGRPR